MRYICHQFTNRLTTAMKAVTRLRVFKRDRPVPDFVIVGAQKAGTSSLFHYLGQHPQLSPSRVKEIHFFDNGKHGGEDNFQKGKLWYLSHFENDVRERRSLTFEASPMYIFHPLVPRRLFEFAPQVKIIALLRNPADRAISQYFHERVRRREPLPIDDAFAWEEKRLKPALQHNNFKHSSFIYHSYKSRGLYKAQLERFHKYFPGHQILVLCSERFFRDTRGVLSNVFEFLGVDPHVKIRDLQARNVSSNWEKVGLKTYDYLRDFFAGHNQALYEFVGDDFTW